MLVWHLTKNGGFHHWAFVPFDDSNTPQIRVGEAFNFVWPLESVEPIPVGPAEYSNHIEKEEGFFTLYRFTLKRPPNFYAEDHWAIRADKTAQKLLENDLVASFPYARSLKYE